MSPALIVTAALILTAAPSASADPGGRPAMAGRSELDIALEEFLRNAEIVDIEDIGEGITRPRRLILRDGPTTLRAIFKVVDEQGQTEASFADRLEFEFTDRYVYEVAAYRLDRFLGIGLTPTTVIRTVNGETGSLQFWIEKAIKMEEAVERQLPIEDMELFHRRVLLMNVLDALIYNTDRNQQNILVTPDDGGYHLIDHSRAFRMDGRLPPWREDWVTGTLPPEVSERLHALDEPTLLGLMGDLLEKRRIRPILKRRDLLLKRLRKRGHIS